jgi:hypothetical protein
VGNKGLGKGDSVAKPDAITFHTIEKYGMIFGTAFWTAYLKGMTTIWFFVLKYLSLRKIKI